MDPIQFPVNYSFKDYTKRKKERKIHFIWYKTIENGVEFNFKLRKLNVSNGS